MSGFLVEGASVVSTPQKVHLEDKNEEGDVGDGEESEWSGWIDR